MFIDPLGDMHVWKEKEEAALFYHEKKRGNKLFICRNKIVKRPYCKYGQNAVNLLLQEKYFVDNLLHKGYNKNTEDFMKIRITVLTILIIFLIGCTTTRLIVITDEMVKPVIDSEFPLITTSITPDSPVTVWWCLDDRFEGSPVTVISDWIQRYLEELLVKSKQFKVVTRIHLEKIFKEQEFQLTGHVDENTIVSIAKILGAKFMVVPTITQYNTLEMQVLNAETGEITYVSNRILKENIKVAK